MTEERPASTSDGGTLTPAIISRALDELWNGPPAPQPDRYDGLLDLAVGGLRNVFPRTNAWRYLDWTVSADGYRLVIEHGVILGLAYDEDPWPWGDPRWLTSHLIADHEIRRVTMAGHVCDDECACPRCGTPLYYWPFGDDHACQDYTCRYAHGIRAAVGATLDFFSD